MLTQTKSNRGGFGKTPSSNTGLNSQEIQDTSLRVRVDWLQGTIRFASLKERDDILDFLEGYCREKFVLHPGQGRFVGKQWHNAAQGLAGCMLLWNLPEEESDGAGHLFFSLTATALFGMEARNIWRVCWGLRCRWKARITRVDVAIDDYSKTVTYEQITDAGRKRNYSGFKKYPVVTYTYEDGRIAGYTIKFGRRGSDRLLRIYDKEFESQGRIKSQRWELELHDELAQKAIDDWLAIESEVFEEFSPRYLGGLVVGVIDFVERGKDKNVTRMPRLAWWEAFKQKVGFEIRHSRDAVATSCERKKRWLTRQVMVTLAMLKKVMGIQGFQQYLKDELSRAEGRFNTYHSAFINVYGRGGAEIDFSWDMSNA